MAPINSLSIFLIAASTAFAAEQVAYQEKKWVLEEHLGNLSPWHKAPVPEGIREDLPSDCVVDRIMMMHRHGSRYPLGSELVFIQQLSDKIGNNTDALKKLKLPAELSFLKDGYTTRLGVNDLTGPGRRQLFDAGVDIRMQYPHLQAKTILAGFQDRVIESAQWFQQGFFGRTYQNTSVFTTIPENSVTVSWITPMNTCPHWQYNYGNNLTIAWGKNYLPPIQSRLNAALKPVQLTTDEVHGALWACAYDLAAWGANNSPWCEVFKNNEIEDFEYELDLLMVGAFGHNLPGDMGPVLGSLFVNKLIERFTNANGDAVPVYLEFGHDTTIDMALTALGLAKDKPALTTDKRPANRQWSTTNQVPFAARMIFERFTCSSASTFAQGKPQIRLMLNNSPFPLSSCSKMNAKYGSCDLDDFVVSNKASQSIKWGDSHWNSTCGAAPF